MDELQFGKRDKRGNWTPNERLEPAPLFAFPPQPLKLLKWIPGYFFPWNLLFALSAVAYWRYIVPDVETMKVLAWAWPLKLFAMNCIAVFLFYGAFELHLYYRRAQANRFKYNPRFPADHESPAFFFNRQNADNIMRGFGTGVPIWTGLQVFVLHLFAKGSVPWLTFADNGWSRFGLGLLIPLIHEVHFYLIHRLIHAPFLYSGCIRSITTRSIHRRGHRSPCTRWNTSPILPGFCCMSSSRQIPFSRYITFTSQVSARWWAMSALTAWN